MAETIDDSETFTIALTENGEVEPEKGIPWLLIGAAIILFYLLTRR